MPGTDAELLESWRAGNRLAGAELFRRYFATLDRFFRHKVRCPPEDLIQDTLLKCVESRDRLRQAASFRAYLLTIARNELYMHWRRIARHGNRLDFGVTSLRDLEPSPSKVLVEHRQHVLLQAALAEVPFDLRLMLELHYWEELSTAELAQVMEIPRGTVKSRLFRARKILRGILERLESDTKIIEQTITHLERSRRVDDD